jgi:hypothetical protein
MFAVSQRKQEEHARSQHCQEAERNHFQVKARTRAAARAARASLEIRAEHDPENERGATAEDQRNDEGRQNVHDAAARDHAAHGTILPRPEH